MRLFVRVAVSLLATTVAVSAQETYTFKYPAWYWEEGGVAPWSKGLIAAFEAANPHIKVEATLIPNTIYEQTITTQIAAGDVPDFMPAFTNMIAPMVDAGILAPLDECIAGSSFKNRILPAVRFAEIDGHIYGVPMTMSPQSLIYNKKLLDEAGVGVPTTVQEFVAAAKAVKQKTGQWGYVFPNNSDALFTYIISMQWLTGMGSDWSRADGTITANGPINVTVIGLIKSFLDEQLSPRGLDANSVRTIFAEGRAAFMIDGPWVITQIANSNPGLLSEIGFDLVPTPTHAAVTGGAFFVVPEASPHKADACKLLEIINDPVAQQRYLEDVLQIPGTKVEPSAELLAKYPWVGRMMEIAAKYPGGIGYAPPGYAVQAPEFRQIVADHLARIYAGEVSVQQGLDEAQVALEKWAASL
ncbi:MAG: ABC transporter substrate-binding protein [Parvibaculaceae bacterium]